MSVTLTKENCRANLWYSEPATMWHWTLLFEGGPQQDFHFNGNAKEEEVARRDILATMAFIERTFPTQEFFDAMNVPWTEEDIIVE
jgi:hypothetical protein